MKKSKKWKVYIHTNKTNNKKYIGITCTSLKRRWNNGLGYKTQIFYRAIEKYGWDGFTHEVVADNLSAEEAKYLEQDLIVLFKTKINENGYNVADGGSIGTVKAKSVCQFDGYGNLIHIYSSISEAAYFIGCKDYHIKSCIIGDSFQSHGFVWKYEDDCRDLNKIKKDILNNPKSHTIRPIYQYDLNCNFVKEYSNAREIFDSLGLKTTAIVQCCDGKLIQTQGFYWAYKKDVLNKNSFKPRKKLTNTTKKYLSVVQLDKNGNYLQTFPTVIEAGKKLGINSDVIRQCCHGTKKTSGGFKWAFEKDYIKECDANVSS